MPITYDPINLTCMNSPSLQFHANTRKLRMRQQRSAVQFIAKVEIIPHKHPHNFPFVKNM